MDQRTQQFPNQAAPPSEGPLPPGVLLQQRYQILEVLGSGGMAVVYKARDMRFEKVLRICAIKEMFNTAPDPRLREMVIQSFDREANVLASLNHPAIVGIYDYFSEGSRIYLVMEYVQGQDLEKLIEDSAGPMNPDQVTNWAIEICDILTYLHNHEPPFIFRDLKPSNIMLSDQNRIMLIDFGIAKVFEKGQRGTMIGTAGYPPPEQYRGLAEPRGDIYALGATLHHLLTKRDPRLEPPFSFHDHPIRTANPAVSEALDKIVMKALEYDIDKRFTSAEEMKQALEALRQPATIAVPSATVTFHTSALSFSQTGGVLPVWQFPCEDEIRSSPVAADGVVYIGSYDHNLYAIDAMEGTFIWKYATEDGISSSPFVWGELVLVGSEDRSVYAIHRGTGRILWSTPTRDRVRSSPRVEMDHVFFGSDDHFFYCLNARNGREVWRFETPTYVRSSAAISKELVYFGASDGNLYALDMTGHQKWRYSTNRTILSVPLLHDGIIYVGSMDWNLYALDAEAGWAAWNYRTRGWVISSPAISKSLNLVYVGSADKNVYAVDCENGHKVWNYETEGAVTSSPAVTDEAVYIGSTDGYLYSLDARTGELRWKFHTGASVVSSPVIWQNMVFVGSMNHNLYALLL